MQRVMATTLEEARLFLMKQLQEVMAKRQVSAESDSVEYLVDLLVQNMGSETFFVRGPDGRLEDNVLAQLYSEALSVDEEVKKQKLKRLGDVCMFVTGLFPESLQKKIVDIDYYFGMGGSAYQTLSALQFSQMARNMFAELAKKFKVFSTLLGDLAGAKSTQSNSEVLAIYERWLLTGDEHLREKLVRQGITAPLVVPIKNQH